MATVTGRTKNSVQRILSRTLYSYFNFADTAGSNVLGFELVLFWVATITRVRECCLILHILQSLLFVRSFHLNKVQLSIRGRALVQHQVPRCLSFSFVRIIFCRANPAIMESHTKRPKLAADSRLFAQDLVELDNFLNGARDSLGLTQEGVASISRDEATLSMPFVAMRPAAPIASYPQENPVQEAATQQDLLASSSMGTPQPPVSASPWMQPYPQCLQFSNTTEDAAMPVAAAASASTHQMVHTITPHPKRRKSHKRPTRRIEEVLELEYSAPTSLSRGTEDFLCLAVAENTKDECPICMGEFSSVPTVKLAKCNHLYHRDCIQEALRHSPKCPTCRVDIIEPRGKSPSGTMRITQTHHSCASYENAGSYIINYTIHGGIQQEYHDHPGVPFMATIRRAYLPSNEEGTNLLKRLKYAWMHGLTFSVGTSFTTGRSNVITWSSVHHKTCQHGSVHGFPDPGFFANCNEELDALGVPAALDLA